MEKRKYLIIFLIVFAIYIYAPMRHARHYEYIQDEHIFDKLYRDVNYNTNIKNLLPNCNDRLQILKYSESKDVANINQLHPYKILNLGGEFIPEKCKPLPKSAIIVPYRQRPKQLDIFLNYMHNFLQNQKLHYRIFVIEQMDRKDFNRAKLLNYGGAVAMSMGFKCLILHDVDLLPLNKANLYACMQRPRHMSSSLDVFRFNLPYLTLFGGAVAILSEQFKLINGMSNLYDGWGGEDDDFFRRLEAHNLLPCRFSPTISKYTMIHHKKAKASENRYKYLKYSVERHTFDGLNTLSKNYSVELKDIYTHILVY